MKHDQDKLKQHHSDNRPHSQDRADIGIRSQGKPSRQRKEARAAKRNY